MDRNSVHVQSRRLATFLALERNVLAVAGAMFLLGFGEELWKRFVPKYLAGERSNRGAACAD